jgi:DNA-binding MarR family transcriptional regulator
MDFYSVQDFAPDCSIGFLGRQIHQMGGQSLEPLFVEEGLTHTQWSAMIAIWFGRGNTCATLARDMAHDKGAMTRLVDTLENNGWVARTRSVEDRRIVHLALTDAGRVVALRCRDRVIERWNRWLKDWKPDEVTTLISLMQKLRATMEADAVDGRAGGGGQST